MKLRIHRTWKWVTMPTGRLGGPPPPQQLEAMDVLEYCEHPYFNDEGEDQSIWSPVPLVEDPHPPRHQRKKEVIKLEFDSFE